MFEIVNRHADKAVPAVLGLICAAALWRVGVAAGLHIPLDPNEGWNAYHTAAAMRGGPLYPGPQEYMVNNYPPLSFYIVGTLGLLVGDNIIAGRIASLLAVAVIAAGMFAAGRRFGCSRRASIFPPLLFTTGLLLFTDYVGMDDPQLLAHAIAMGGLLVLLREPRRTSVIAAAAFLFVFALFVKHNVVALAIALAIWLWFVDRRSAFRYVLFGAGFLVAGLVLFRLAYGRSLLNVIATARLYSLDQLVSSTLQWLRWSLVPIAGLAFLVLKHRDNHYVLLCAIYGAVAMVIGLAFLGGAGVDPNVLFDADIALALSAGLVFDRLSGLRALLVPAAYAAPLIYTAVTIEEWHDPLSWTRPFQIEAATASRDIAFIAARPGPALCEMQSFCYWAGKPPAVDVFNAGQQFETGARSDAALSREIERQRFAVIQFDPDSPESLGENIHEAMDRSYRVHHSDEYGTFYVPK
jgi:hypothetical protein